MAKELGGPVLISISLEGIDVDNEHQGTVNHSTIQSTRKTLIN
jgi:hypothetical protein